MTRNISIKFFKILSKCLLAICLILSSCSKNSSNNPVSPPSQTKAGEIGTEGGSVVSNDKNVQLQIPQGALSSSTPVEISTSTDSLPGGFCVTYNFTPNGLKFNKPATLTIHYNDSLLAGINPLNAGIGYEDDKGNWYGVAGGSVDTVKHTFTVPISHFSKWGIYEVYFISRENVVANKTAILTNSSTLFNVFKSGLVIEDDGGLAPLNRTPVSPNHWLVNGTIWGTSTVGTIQPSPNVGEAIYTSPVKMPDSNPVAVSAEIILPNSSKLFLICNTEILAKYWRYIHINTSGFQCAGGWECHFTYGDTIEVDFQLGSNFQVSEWLPGLHFYSVTDVGSCDPQWGINVQTGNPQQVTDFSGGYDISSNLIKLNVGMVEADYWGFTITIGNETQHQDVETGQAYTDPVVFPANSSNTYSLNDKDKGLPRFDGYTWILSENDNP